MISHVLLGATKPNRANIRTTLRWEVAVCSVLVLQSVQLEIGFISSNAFVHRSCFLALSSGGALVAPDVVLFAAHCGDWSNRQVIVGAYETRTVSEGAESRFCIEWIEDPDYVPSTTNSDFALCKLDKPVDIDSAVILELNEDASVPEDGEDLTVVGLGRLESGGDTPQFIQEVDVPYVPNNVCNSAYNGRITEKMLCAGIIGEGGRDSCQGDSGGPIVKKIENADGTSTHVHVGVVSWGIGCALAAYPGVYARTSYRVGWIKDKICNDLESVADFCDNAPFDDSCDGAEVSITIDTDMYAYETTWSLYDVENTLLERRRYLANWHESEVKVCLPNTSTCYDLEITDSYGDGMFTSAGCGSYNIAVDGEEKATGNPNFGDKTTETFCVTATDNDTDGPTGFPTQQPSSFPTTSEAPTAADSESPTSAPTATPTDAPTDAPTAADSESPTSAPTDAPTDEPTAAPTTSSPSASPSESPTISLSPSQSPTQSPSQSPSQSPTQSPSQSPSAATESPSQSPTTSEPVCTLGNDSTFRWKNKNNKNCWKFIKGNNVNKMVKKCKKKWLGKPVHEWCPQRCGFIAGVGQCDFLLAQRALKNKTDTTTTSKNDTTTSDETDDKKKVKKGKKKKKDQWKHLFEE